MRQILVSFTLGAVMLEALLLLVVLQLTISMTTGFLKLLEHFHQQQI